MCPTCDPTGRGAVCLSSLPVVEALEILGGGSDVATGGLETLTELRGILTTREPTTDCSGYLTWSDEGSVV